MFFGLTHILLLLIVLAFWGTLLWAIVVMTTSLKRISVAVERMAERQTDRPGA